VSYFTNEVKIYGDDDTKKEFITNFLKYGFESYFPVPKVLINYNIETSRHKKLIEKVLGRKLKAWFTDLYSKEARRELLEKLKDYTPENKTEEKLKQEILTCLTETGYISLWNFREEKWGTDRNAWKVGYDEKKDILKFETAWNPPVAFFTAISEKLNLSFVIKAVNGFSTTCKTIIVERGRVTDEMEHKSEF